MMVFISKEQFSVRSQTGRTCAVFSAVSEYLFDFRTLTVKDYLLTFVFKWKYSSGTQDYINQILPHHGKLLQWTTCSISTTANTYARLPTILWTSDTKLLPGAKYTNR